ncbi:hypothetical protein EIP86_009189 [Pleurotus ostreatoroseus]|nr:hypothetical protein EIP86_009189 [Pleurotus ostreatoroseus]
MDLGVGSFVFSQGIVSAIPLIKNPSYLKSPTLPKLVRVARKCSPLLILGLIRTLSVKGTDYPEHETEYGTHWNFFFTMGLIPILEVLLHPFLIHLPVSSIGVCLAISHQIALSAGGLMEFALHAPRVGVVSANKEGIISLTGYLSIHLIGLSTGTLLLPPSPSYFRRIQATLRGSSSAPSRSDASDPTYDSSDDDTPSRRSTTRLQYIRENDKTATELFSYAAIWWIVLGIVSFLHLGGGVSRRVVNLPYIIWISAFNTTFILGYLVLDLVFFPSPLSKSVYSPTSKLKVQPDPALLRTDRRFRAPDGIAPAPLFEAINKNGLILFLLANVVTGLINMAIPTIDELVTASDVTMANRSVRSVQDIVIPQRQYAVNIQRNHTHSIETVKYFVNGVQGISLRDAQAHNFRGLHAAEDRPLEGFGVKWPGYGSFNRQKHALRATREKESVTRAKMAVHVAEVIKDFIQEMESMHTTEPAWRVGSGYIALEDLYLLEIHQVAKASLQPVIAYRPRVWGNQYPHSR